MNCQDEIQSIKWNGLSTNTQITIVTAKNVLTVWSPKLRKNRLKEVVQASYHKSFKIKMDKAFKIILEGTVLMGLIRK